MMRSWQRVGWIALAACLILGLSRVRFDIEILNLLPAEAPAVIGLKLYQGNFSNARELILTVRANSLEVAESQAQRIAEALRRHKDLVSDVTWRQPWLEHPRQAAELVGYLWANQPPSLFGQLTNRLAKTNLTATLLETRQKLTTSLSPQEIARLSRDPYNLLDVPSATRADPWGGQAQDPFASPSGTFRLVFVRAAEDLLSYRACQQWLKAIHQVVDANRQGDPFAKETEIHFTGRPAFVAEIAGGMERDIHNSVGSTLLIVAALFWWAHRSWRPLLWIVALLILLLIGTLAVGGLFMGTLNVVSIGFAAILLGLAVDYGLVLYQEHRAEPELSAAQIRKRSASGIIWSAVTTAGAFFLLNLGGLPGLGQLGSLVGIGVCLAAFVMLYAFLPPLLSRRSHQPRPGTPALPKPRARAALSPAAASAVTVLVVIASSLILWFRPPVLNHSPDPLRPKQSSAYATLAEIRTEMRREKDPLWLVVTGSDEETVGRKLDAILPVLESAKTAHQIEDFTLPGDFWPRPANQSENRATAQTLIRTRRELHEVAEANGFTAESLGATDAILDGWEAIAAQPGVYWPSNSVSSWLFSKFTARDGQQHLVLGLIYPAEPIAAALGGGLRADSQSWMASLPKDGVWLAGWELLGSSILQVVERDLWKVLLSILSLVAVSLWIAFRNLKEMALSFGTLSLSGLCLLASMAVFGWSWNLLNLMAIPLLIGSGVDYSIHMQLALRRYQGDIATVRHIVGRALFLCAATTTVGFGSLAWSNNAGLASLGAVCATGIACTFLTSTALLPVWWLIVVNGNGDRDEGGATATPPPSTPRPADAPSAPSSAARPSFLYRADLWRAGLWLVRRIPVRLGRRIAEAAADIYWRCNQQRRQTVIQNLQPVLAKSKTDAVILSRLLFRQFAVKLYDLWLYETGAPVESMISDISGWEQIAAAQARGRGTLLVTTHVGNWELGAPLLASRGLSLSVVTLLEPDPGLTELRRASRLNRGVETLVIGDNPFRFIEVMRRLEARGCVALLVDRPTASATAEIRLFGQPFVASTAAAELARATGCAILPVCIARRENGYRAEVLPEIFYDPKTLGHRLGRVQLTQEIMRAFEPIIEQYLTQWYHFIPIWPKRDATRDSEASPHPYPL